MENQEAKKLAHTKTSPHRFPFTLVSHSRQSCHHQTMPGTIRVGCKVSSLIGRMLPLTRTQKRRSRQRFFGTVIKSCANQKWTVYWDEIDRCADHAYNNLRYESNSGMTLVGVNVDAILATKHLGSADNKVIDRFLATWHPPATPLPLAQNVQVLPQMQPSVVETVEEQSAETMETPTTIDLQPVTMHKHPQSPTQHQATRQIFQIF